MTIFRTLLKTGPVRGASLLALGAALCLALCWAALPGAAVAQEGPAAAPSAPDVVLEGPVGLSEVEGFGVPEPAPEPEAVQEPVKPIPDAGKMLVLAVPQTVDLGAPFALRLTSDWPLGEVTVHWLGRETMPSISVWNDRHVALALLGTDIVGVTPGEQELVVEASVDGERRVFNRKVNVLAKIYPERKVELPEGLALPPKSEYERISKDRKVVKNALEVAGPKRLWSLPLLPPVEQGGGVGEVIAPYGLRLVTGQGRAVPRRAVDLSAPAGTPVKAVAAGRVLLANEQFYAGKAVYLDHGNGVVSFYNHLSELDVSPGDEVARGQMLGKSGQSGRTTGPHLNFGVAVRGQLVDPMPLVTKNADQLLGD